MWVNGARGRGTPQKPEGGRKEGRGGDRGHAQPRARRGQPYKTGCSCPRRDQRAKPDPLPPAAPHCWVLHPWGVLSMRFCPTGGFSHWGFLPLGFSPTSIWLPRGHPEEQLGIRKTPSKGSRMGLHGLRAEEYLGAKVQSRQGGSSGSNEEAANTRGARGEAQQARCDAGGFLRDREEPRVSGLEAKLLPPFPPLHPLPLRLQISACSCWT